MFIQNTDVSYLSSFIQQVSKRLLPRSRPHVLCYHGMKLDSYHTFAFDHAMNWTTPVLLKNNLSLYQVICQSGLKFVEFIIKAKKNNKKPSFHSFNGQLWMIIRILWYHKPKHKLWYCNVFWNSYLIIKNLIALQMELREIWLFKINYMFPK